MIAFIDERMSHSCQYSLKNIGIECVFVNKNINLDEPVSAHPDMMIFQYKNDIIVEKSIENTAKKHLFEKNKDRYNIIVGANYSNKTAYPYDCSLNFAVCGKHIIGNESYASEQVRSVAKKHGLVFINVKQGYAKCNICVVNDNAIITEDKGIARECEKFGIDVLLLKENCVKLDGYKYGFIGGATGTLTLKDKNTILFCGCVERHPEYKYIKEFALKHNSQLLSLSDEDLYDRGSIIIYKDNYIPNYIK